jgi:integrase
MENQIKVTVVEFGDRKHYQMQYRDPMTGRKKTRSTEIERTGRKPDRTAAERAAAKWEDELRDGRYQPPSRIGWEEFRERFENEVLPGLAEKTATMFGTVFNAIEKILTPAKLSDLTASRLSHFQAELRAGGRAEATVRTYLAHLKSSLHWATDVGLMRAVPKIQKPQRAKGGKVMKGRPIMLEEFERMLAQVVSIVGEAAGPAWTFYLNGLWASGLRLAESLELFWDQQGKLCIDLAGKRPMMRIPADLEKGNQDRLLPLAPEFAEFLLAVPEVQRFGRVFKLVNSDGSPREFQADWVGRVVSAIGEKAGVKVNTKWAKGAEVVKFASAHDLRRSFGERWASRVMPQVLMELMRHESIETTLKYYVGRNAQTTADVLWQAHERQQQPAGNTSGNSAQNRDRGEVGLQAATSCVN